MRRIDISQQKFGRLLAIEPVPGTRKWMCLCDCGNSCEVAATHLKAGHTRSCGCLAREVRERRVKENTTHGYYIGGRPDKFICIYNGMMSRCYNPNSKFYAGYGGRGIRVCEEWRTSKVAFHKWCEDTYIDGRTIDRIDNDGDYSPENCRWADKTTQARNRRSNVIYETSRGRGCQAELSAIWGIDEKLVSARIHYGWSPEKAFSTPPRKGNYRRGSRAQ